MTRPSEKPFVIELEQRDRAPGGYFTPGAALKITSALRTSGLLRALPPEDVAWLMFLLTFVTPNGECRVHLEHLSEAMEVSMAKADRRMSHLAQLEWQGAPLVVVTRPESGLAAYSLSHHVITYEQKPPPVPAAAPLFGGFRDQIIAHSRAKYTRPRAEVERIIAEQLGHPEPQSDNERTRQELLLQLENAGVTSEQARHLLGTYDDERIKRQLAWLPYRNAKNPAGFLIAAIEADYAEPLSLRFTELSEESTDELPAPAQPVGNDSAVGDSAKDHSVDELLLDQSVLHELAAGEEPLPTLNDGQDE